MSRPARDRFDAVPRSTGRVGAHRAEHPRMNGWVVLAWAVVATAVLVSAGVFGALVVTGRITPFPEAVPTIEPEPEETGIVDTTYSVLILNGTPEEGLDAQLRDQLVNAGWSGDDVFAGPSGTTSFSATTVYYLREDDALAAIGLAGLIGGAEVEQSDFYGDPEDPEERQLTIVIGLDRSSGTTSPEPDAGE